MERDKVKKWEGRLGEIRTPREYAALSREIDIAKKTNDAQSEQLKALARRQPTSGRRSTRRPRRSEREVAAQGELQELDQATAAAEQKLRELDGRRAEAAKRVDPGLLGKYENIKRRRAGIAVAPVVGMTCKGCHRNIPPQLAITLQRANSIETCPNCHRIIYSADAVNPPAPPSPRTIARGEARPRRAPPLHRRERAASQDLHRYSGYDRDTLGKLINAAADRIEEGEKARDAAAPGGSKGIKVRRQTDVEKAAARSAAELDEAMDLSKAERDQRRRERAAQAEREAAQAAQAEVEERAKRTRLYTDGAARGNPGPAGAGAVIVNPDGHIVAKVGKFLGESTNNVAEYMGLILGLKRAKAMGIKELEVLADSELLVKQLAGDYAVKAEHLKPLHDEAQQLLKAFSWIEVRHIPREENAQADAMSNRAIDERL